MGYLVIAASFALAGALVARVKGNSVWMWFLISGAIPFIGLLAAILARAERDTPTRPCPRCRRTVKVHDALCTRCGQELEFPEPEPFEAEPAELSTGR